MSSAQKVIKYFAIFFAISLIVCIFSGIYQALGVVGGILTNNQDGKGLNIKHYPNSSNVLSVDVISSRLKIVEGDHFKIESDSKYIISKQDYNKLSVKEKNKGFFETRKNKVVTIYIPKDMVFDKVYISNKAGTIDIESMTTRELELEIGAGKVDIDEITSLNNTNIESGAGKVTINSAKLNNLNLDAGVGKFTINGKLTGKAKIDAGVGDLSINLLGYKDDYGIYVETGIGNINIDGNKVKDNTTYGIGNNKVDIDGGVGNINIRFLGVR